MRNKPRNSDGTIRRANKPKQLTSRSLIARWVEAETLHLKRLGMGYQAIADHMMEIAQGQRMATPKLSLCFGTNVAPRFHARRRSNFTPIFDAQRP